MAVKPNYRHQRTERSRIKQQRKQEKLLKRQEKNAMRKAARDPVPEAEEPRGT